MKKKLLKALNLTFLFGGMYIIYLLGKEFGWLNIWNWVKAIELSNLMIVLFFPFSWMLLHAIGWYFLIDEKKKFSFFHVLAAQISSMAVSEMPMGQAGGEPYRGYYLRKHYGRENSHNFFASVVLYNTIHSIITGLLFFGGFIGILFAIDVQLYKILIFLAAMLLGAIFVFTLIQKQKKGMFGKIFDLLEKIKFFKSFVERKREKAEQIDERLARFYAHHKSEFFYSFFFILIAKSLGAVEFYLIMDFVGYPIPFLIAFVVFAGTSVIQLIFFFFPMGPAELSIVYLLKSLGQNATAANVLALLRRVRVILWTIIGLIIAFFWGPKLGEKHQ